MPEAELAAPTVENVRVVVRVRPMDQREKIDGAYSCVSVDLVNNTVAVSRTNVTPVEPPRIYAYDAVFDSDTTQGRPWYMQVDRWRPALRCSTAAVELA